MEFFILALVARLELRSTYAFRVEAGLEPGGIRSALKRLVDAKLITRADEARRRRRDIALTDHGVDVLGTSWRECLHEEGDAESILRAALVAWLMNGPDAAAGYLHRVAESRREKAEEMGYKSMHAERSQKGFLSSYAWMRASLEAHRRKAESKAFLSMSRFIEEQFKNSERQEASS
ncbi:MAG: hypothetical protein ABSE53_16795 [Terracidiphilus sp.]|jgi:DNA-binding MarR family transcriptional regulator